MYAIGTLMHMHLQVHHTWQMFLLAQILLFKGITYLFLDKDLTQSFNERLDYKALVT